MIEIQCLNKQQLAEFVDSESFQNLPDLPISVHRAVSHCRNPRAGDNDPLLIIAWLEGVVVGYLGVLTDQYFLNRVHPERCGWLTCLWVNEQHRGKSIAKAILTKGLEAIDGRVLLTDYTPQSKRIYDKIGAFTDMPARTGIRLYHRLALQQLLPPKSTVFEKIKPLLQVTDAIANVLVDAMIRLRSPKKRCAHWEYLEEVTDEIQQFIAGKQDGELFRRGKAELNWAIKNPWILSAPPDEMSRRYYFSSVDRSFDFVCVRVCDAEGRLCAFLIFAKRHRSLKLPCCYLSKGSSALAAEVIDWHIRQWGINTFTTFHPELVQYYRTNRTFAVHKKTFKRYYIASKRMAESLAGHTFELQDGDGDSFFT